MDEYDLFFEEDLKSVGDITSDALFSDEQATAFIISKSNGIVAGLYEAEQIFKKVSVNIKLLKNDGDKVLIGEKIAQIKGSVKSILKAERLSLNFICRMSGIATETRKIVEMCHRINPDVEIAATRKTTPGFRKYEKKAVIIGGGISHRYGLYDEVLIKDNHIKIVGNLTDTIKRIKHKNIEKQIEVEVENIEDAIAAANLGVDIIMLDNFRPNEVEKVYKNIKNINKEILVEISGGIKPDNIIKYARFSDRISLGYLTHSVKNMDFSLEIS